MYSTQQSDGRAESGTFDFQRTGFQVNSGKYSHSLLKFYKEKGDVMNKKSLVLVIFVCSFFLVSAAYANLYDFNSGTSGFTTFGTATPYSGSVQLTAPIAGQAGSIFLNTTLNATSFNASFDFWNAEPYAGIYGGDGITFAWVTTPGVGGRGGELGFTGLTGYMVEFDTYWNSGYDPNDTRYNSDDPDHIAVATTVVSPLAYSKTPEMEQTGWHHVDIAFSNGLIQVQMDDIEYINHLIGGYVGSDAYFGFTGSTGASYSRQLIDNFDITVNQNPVPVPPTLLLFGSGLLGLIGIRTRKKS